MAVPDVVEVCKTDVAYNCDKQGPVECETLYDNVCETTRTVHTVEDDVATCSLVQETDQSCVDYNNGNLIIHSSKPDCSRQYNKNEYPGHFPFY